MNRAIAINCKTLALAAMAVMQLGDLITTNLVLAHGGDELNPVMARCQASFGSCWAIPKLAAAV